MTEKVIQVNIEELKKSIQNITSNLKMMESFENGYYHSVFSDIRKFLDDQKIVSAYNSVVSIENDFDAVYNNFKKLKEILKQGGCDLE